MAFPAQATDYYVNESTGSDGNDGISATVVGGGVGPWATIGKCATIMVAGDNCTVASNGDVYDARITPGASGSAGNPITYKAATDCDPASSSTCPKVRGFSITTKNYITTRGFEITNSGMGSDTNESVLLTDGNHNRVEYNYIHDTTSSAVEFGGSSSGQTELYVGYNTIDYAGVTSAILGTTSQTFTITTGVNDVIEMKVDGGAADSATINPASCAANPICTGQEIASQVQAGITGLTCLYGATGKVGCWVTQTGVIGHTLELTASSTAAATLGMTVGMGVALGDGIGIGPRDCSGGSECSNLLFEHNTISHVADHFNVTRGSEIIVRNNTFGPNHEDTPRHIDGVQMLDGAAAITRLLVEGNRSSNNRNKDNHFFLNQGDLNDHQILRFNQTYLSNGGFTYTSGDFVNLYNNTVGVNAQPYLTGSVGQFGSCSGSTNFTARNNIWYKAVNPSTAHVYTASGCTGSMDGDYDLWVNAFSLVTDGQPNAVNSDPLFVDEAGGDFRLQAGSPARTGGGLTNAVGAGVATVTLVVGNAYPFQDGWTGLAEVVPDCIAIGTVTNVHCIASIDYATNTITLATAASWNNDDPVYSYSISDGTRVLCDSTPNIGAEPYGCEAAGTRLRGRAQLRGRAVLR